MKNLSRRDFLSKSALGIGSAVLASQMPFTLNAATPVLAAKMPIGFQVWTIKDSLVRDFPGTLKKMADIGFQSVEMCSPPGYESSGFGPLMKLTAKEMKKIINDAGLLFPSSHYGFGEFRDHLDERISFAAESGQTQMILSSFGLPRDAKLDDWKKAAGELNKMGMKAKSAGIQMGYHNHNNEFAQLEGSLIYDVLMKEFDPDYIKMQFQVAVISIGYKAADYFRKYPGRFISIHFADYAADKKQQVAVGKGIVDWKELFAAIPTGGAQNYFVEMAEETFRDSVAYLKKI